MYDITLDDVRERRKQLEREVQDAINRFKRDTGVEIISLSADFVEMRNIGENEETLVRHVDVMLDV